MFIRRKMGTDESRYAGSYDDPEKDRHYSWTIDLKKEGAWYSSVYVLNESNMMMSGWLPPDLLQKFLEDEKEMKDPINFRIDFERFLFAPLKDVIYDIPKKTSFSG